MSELEFDSKRYQRATQLKPKVGFMVFLNKGRRMKTESLLYNDLLGILGLYYIANVK